MPAHTWTAEHDLQLMLLMYFDPAAEKTYSYYGNIGERLGFNQQLVK